VRVRLDDRFDGLVEEFWVEQAGVIEEVFDFDSSGEEIVGVLKLDLCKAFGFPPVNFGDAGLFDGEPCLCLLSSFTPTAVFRIDASVCR